MGASAFCYLQWFDADGWVSGRTSHSTDPRRFCSAFVIVPHHIKSNMCRRYIRMFKPLVLVMQVTNDGVEMLFCAELRNK